MGRIYDYKAKYSHYLELRKDVSINKKAYDEQQRMIADNRTFIDRFKGTLTDAVQSRVKMLEKLVIVQVDEVDNSSLKLKFPATVRSQVHPVIEEQYGQKAVIVAKNEKEVDHD
jgi:ATP-binding cassette subfamily F protein 3